MKSITATLRDSILTTSDELGATEHVLTAVVGTFFAADMDWLARPLIRFARWRHRNLPIARDHGQAESERPHGPFTIDSQRDCAVLIFVPRSLKSHFIDDLTGADGYSHVAVDVGETDVPTRKPVMTEATLGDVVHRSFQDTYGDRPYLRVPLRSFGADCARLRACVTAKLGQPYSDKEALTWGAIDDPAKQICSDLVANCLPDRVRDDIVRGRGRRRVHPFAVSVHRLGRREPYVFVSPNGFAEYIGAPPGRQIERPNVLFHPQLPESTVRPAAHPRLSRQETVVVLGLTLIVSILIGVLVRRQYDLR